LRIIGGKYSGLVIRDPKGFNSRITTDRAKEALFNIINSNFYFEDIAVLDMFGGSGNITYEFISRGVKSIVVIEQNVKNFKFIASNLKLLKAKSNVKIVKGDALKKIYDLQDEGYKFDLIFADPPFAAKFVGELPSIVFDSGVLSAGGWLIIEHDKSNSFSSHPHLIDERNYGGVHFSILEFPGDNA